MRPEFKLGDRLIGENHPCFVIAEVGVNHGGEVDTALLLIDAAAAAGADAVKFQTFSAETLVSDHAEKAEYQKRSTGAGTQKEMLNKLTLASEAYPRLIERCRKHSLTFLSSAFSSEDGSFLEDLGVPAFKVGSGELTHTTLLRHVARFKKPVILSTGMADMNAVRTAVKSLLTVPFALLHCVSAYPAPLADMNIRAIATLREEFRVPVGLSDHCLDHEAALGAVALGACILERHLTLDPSAEGPDHAASSSPDDFAAYVQSVRRLEAALGDGEKVPTSSETDVMQVARKSLFARRMIRAGEVLQEEHLVSLRPGSGISPAEVESVIGRTALQEISQGTMISREMLT